jgi:hypothetical protein
MFIMSQLKRTAFETAEVNLWENHGYRKVFKNTPEVHELITIPKYHNDNEPFSSIETEMNFFMSNPKITITNFNTNSYYILLLSQMFPMIPQKKNILIRVFSYVERIDKFPTCLCSLMVQSKNHSLIQSNMFSRKLCQNCARST